MYTYIYKCMCIHLIHIVTLSTRHYWVHSIGKVMDIEGDSK